MSGKEMNVFCYYCNLTFLVNYVLGKPHFEGWERKRSKCFFTYLYLDHFCYHPLIWLHLYLFITTHLLNIKQECQWLPMILIYKWMVIIWTFYLFIWHQWHYSFFMAIFTEVTFYPVSDLPFSLRPLKDLRDNKNSTGIATVYGPEIVGCSTRDRLATTTTTTPVPTKPVVDGEKVGYDNIPYIKQKTIWNQNFAKLFK